MSTAANDPPADKPGPKKTADERVVIQKYANRRLYNKATSTYITLDNLAEMVRNGVDFVVYDAKTNEDITRKVLTQIIFEEENSGGQNLLPIQFLRQLISFYGDSMQSFLPSYLELSLDSFTRQQERLRAQFANGQIPGLQGPGFLEDQVRQNLVLFDRAMKMFSPFSYGARADEPPAAAAPQAKPADESSFDELKKQVAAMQAQIEKLATKG
jgi:polyhydroxyalkanoate synthesis repressor PhaR